MVGLMRWMFGASLSVVLVSCTAPNPRVCQDGGCRDPRFPFCDVDGSFEGNSNTCIAVSCEATEFAGCRGTDEVVCNSDGSNYVIQSCEFGCSEVVGGCQQCEAGASTCSGDALTTCLADGTLGPSEACRLGCVESSSPHCAHVVPRYLPEICDTPATGSLVISNSATFNTTLDASCTGGIVVQTGGPEICVVHHERITIEAGVSLVVTGPRAIAFVADRDVSIAGLLDVSADFITNGPGGGTIRSGAAGVTPNGTGGAGFKTTGGAGGSATLNGGAGNGGAAFDPASLSVLVGGPQVVPDAGNNDSFGAGGGAATLVSCRGTVDVTGEIHAGGGGGAGGFVLLVAAIGGLGGGAGGNVVFQGAQVTITGKLFSNGGSGGAGRPTNAGNGARGYEGDRSVIAVTGGVGTSGAGSGGAGGSGTTIPGAGGAVTGSGGTAGGGGGSVGFFQSYTPIGVTPTLTPSAASPAPQPNGTIPTR